MGEALTKVNTAALEKMDKAVARLGGPRVDAGESEHDRRKSFGHQLCMIAATVDSDIPAATREESRNVLEKMYGSKYRHWDQKAALAEGAGVQGGYTVFPEFSSDLLKIAIEESVLASRGRIIPMAGAEVHIPQLDQTTAPSSGQTAYTGGMVASWQAEAAARSETEPKFKQVTLRANELTGYSLASRTLLADNGVGLEALLSTLIRETVSWYLDYGCFQGTGANQPLGVLNAPGLVTTASRDTSSKFKLADAATMLGYLLPKCRRAACWFMGPDVFQQLVQLVDASGRVVFLPNLITGAPTGSAQVMPDNNMILFGLPVFFTEKLPALGTKGDVMLIDPQFYLIGKRQEIEIAASEHYRFINNQIAWRFVARVDGQPWLDKPFTLQDTSRQLSAYVALHT
jgi:HK97 family phage major capsid protein